MTAEILVFALITGSIVGGLLLRYFYGWYRITKRHEGIYLVQDISRHTCYKDKRGYLRYRSDDQLVHRAVAYQYIFKMNPGGYPFPFASYDVHHKDKDKCNAQPSNLEVLSRGEHMQRHGRFRRRS